MANQEFKVPNRILSPKVTKLLYDLFEIDAKLESHRDQYREWLKEDPAGAVEDLLIVIHEQLSVRGSSDLESTVGKGAGAFFLPRRAQAKTKVKARSSVVAS